MEKQPQPKYAFVLDGKGFIVGAELVYEGESCDFAYTTESFPTGVVLIKPKWNGVEWIEGETEEEKAERESQQLLESLKPTPEELANAELEIKLLTMLTELEVIQ